MNKHLNRILMKESKKKPGLPKRANPILIIQTVDKDRFSDNNLEALADAIANADHTIYELRHFVPTQKDQDNQFLVWAPGMFFHLYSNPLGSMIEILEKIFIGPEEECQCYWDHNQLVIRYENQDYLFNEWEEYLKEPEEEASVELTYYQNYWVWDYGDCAWKLFKYIGRTMPLNKRIEISSAFQEAEGEGILLLTDAELKETRIVQAKYKWPPMPLKTQKTNPQPFLDDDEEEDLGQSY